MPSERYSGVFSVSILKIIAIVTMLIDHIGAFIINYEKYTLLYEVMRTVGRIAFPIFCFMLVQGFRHTRSVKKYMIRLFIFAIISEVPFDLAASSVNESMWMHQNVFFTLFIGLTALYIIEKYKQNAFAQIIVIISACTLATFLYTDYMFFGVLQIIFFYYFEKLRLCRIISIIFLNFYMGQPAGAVALVFTELYNGKRGINVKYLAYAFYPVHLLVIWLMRTYCI